MGSTRVCLLVSLLFGATYNMVEGEAEKKLTVADLKANDNLQNCACHDILSTNVDKAKQLYHFTAKCACDIVQAAPDEEFKSDVVFLIETSSRVNEDNLEKVKFFVTNVMRTFKSGEDEKAFWSVLSYAAGKTKTLAWLKQCKVLKTCMKGVDDVVTAGGEPNVGKALKYALKFSFQERFGGNRERQNVLLFVGSGDTTEKEETAKQLAKAKTEDVNVYYIAVDGQVDKAWLESSFPGETHLVVNPDDLSKKETLQWVERIFN
ncbi:uncharacterized protein LOC135495119 [Lineus longissimus]|uniref:uncharacterized protein LOC135495119 n=1 Tax=Lineus longissimus TaxID=88925 RepID=UPI00315D8226